MDYKGVDTLFITFGWVREFILKNGILHIPEYVAFILETCGILHWLLIFIFLISLLVGYSRQMSSFYFHYQYLLGQKLRNPYLSSFVIVMLWITNQILAGGTALTTVYFIKYGYIVGALVGFGTVITVLTMFVIMRIMVKGSNKKAQPHPQQMAPQPMPQPQYYPVHAQVVHQTDTPQILYLQAPMVMQPQSNAPDPQFEEAIMILGLKRDFTKAELESQYRKLIKKVHADKGGSDGLYLKVKQCYEFLLSRMQ